MEKYIIKYYLKNSYESKIAVVEAFCENLALAKLAANVGDLREMKIEGIVSLVI